MKVEWNRKEMQETGDHHGDPEYKFIQGLQKGQCLMYKLVEG